jgi:hypothetical protein
VTLTADRSASQEYRLALEDYLTRVVSRDGSFCCASAPSCRASVRAGHQLAEGQLSYVGDGYVVSVDGREERILIVSMQVGDSEAPVTMDRRKDQVHVRVPQLPKERNAHMRGVTYALQILLGLDVGPTTERLGDGTHVLEAYAMANSTLCSNLPTGGASRRGGPTANHAAAVRRAPPAHGGDPAAHNHSLPGPKAVRRIDAFGVRGDPRFMFRG